MAIDWDSMPLAECVDFGNNPFTNRRKAEKYFDAILKTAEENIKILRKSNLADMVPTGYGASDYVNQLQNLYRIITRRDFDTTIERVIEDTKQQGKRIIGIGQVQETDSTRYMKRLLAERLSRGSGIKMALLSAEQETRIPDEVYLVCLDDVIYTGFNAAVNLRATNAEVDSRSRSKPALYVAGSTRKGGERAILSGLNWGSLHAVRRIPMISELFSYVDMSLWIMQNNEVNAKWLLDGDPAEDLLRKCSLDFCAAMTEYRLPDLHTLPDVLREYRGRTLFSLDQDIRRYPHYPKLSPA